MSSTQQNPNNIYITLDSLLDTRLGTLIKINNKFAFNVSNNEKYYNRQIDDFEDDELGSLSKDNYDKVYSTFKNEIIHLSLKTKMYKFLKELCGILLEKTIATPYGSDIEVHVNIHPFNLNDEEIKLLSKAISFHLNNLYSVKIINISLEDLNCKHVKENYCAMIMYNYGEWMNLHQLQMQKREVKNVALYIPRINFVRLLTEEEVKDCTTDQGDIFDTLSIIVREFITMQFLPISLYCADLPINT